MTIKERTRAANRIIDAIADNGPCALYSPVADRKARLGLDRVESLWYIDHFTGLRLYPFAGSTWCGFTGSNNLREIVGMLAKFARDAAPLDADRIASLLDGYSDAEKAKVRAEVALETGECRYCNGIGEVEGQGSYADFEPPIRKCSECNGTGKVVLTSAVAT